MKLEEPQVKELIAQEVKQRELNFELLRVFCAIIIIAFHFSDHGGLINLEFGNNMILGYFLNIFGNLGVHCFILISGYFLSTSKFKSKKLFKLILQVMFYSIVLYIIAIALGIIQPEMLNVLENIFPISYKTYWFVTPYVAMYILSPFINKFINRVSKNELKNLLVVLTILLSIIHTLLIGSNGFISDLAVFIYLYLIVAYIKKYKIDIKDNKKLLLIIASCILLMFGISLLLRKLNFKTELSLYLNSRYSLPMIILSVTTFMLFKNISIKKSKIIPFLAKATFGVYLIHINNHFIETLFHKIIKIDKYYQASTLKLIIYISVWVFIIYTICIIIDTLRRKLLEEPLFKIKILDKKFEKIDSFVNYEEKEPIRDNYV